VRWPTTSRPARARPVAPPTACGCSPTGSAAGPGAARNRGLRAARQPLVAFLDADDEYLPGRFAASVPLLLASPQLDGVCEAVAVAFEDEEARRRWQQEDGRERIEPPAHVAPEALLAALLSGAAGNLCTDGVLVRREAALAVGGFEESLPAFEDTALWWKLAARGRLAPGERGRAVAVYHRRSGSASAGAQARREGAVRQAVAVWRWSTRGGGTKAQTRAFRAALAERARASPPGLRGAARLAARLRRLALAVRGCPALLLEPALWRAPLSELALVGLAFALVESLAAFFAGRHPASDLAWIAGLSFVLALAVGVPVGVAARGLGARSRGLLQAAALIPLVLLMAARAGGAAPQAAGVALACGALLVAPGRRARGLGAGAFTALSLAGFAIATTFALLERAPWTFAGRGPQALLAALSLALLAALALRGEGLGRFALAAGLVLSSLAVFASQPPPTLPVPAPQPGVARAPNVLLVVMDTVRRDRTSLHGYSRPTTPELERLARRSVVFSRAVASGSYSLASHASLLTGALPSVHGAHPGRADSGHLPLRAERPTLPQALSARGYASGGIVANHAMFASWTGLDRALPALAATPRRACGLAPTAFAALHRAWGADPPLPCHETWPADAITRAALRWVEGVGTRPFFLFLNYFDAHAPYAAPAAFRRRLPPPDGAGPAGGYDAAVSFVDAELGALLRGLERQGRAADTLVVVTSDHGELLGEGGAWGHPALPREEVLGVPLLIALPGASGRHDENRRVGHHHVWPLIEAALAGAPPEALAATLHGSEPAVLSELWTEAPGDRELRLTRVAYEGSLKLVERAGGPALLFDLAGAGDAAPLGGERARAEIERLRAALPPLVEPPPRRGIGASPEQLEALRALGYLGR
jgi:hypothetical protein